MVVLQALDGFGITCWRALTERDVDINPVGETSRSVVTTAVLGALFIRASRTVTGAVSALMSVSLMSVSRRVVTHARVTPERRGAFAAALIERSTSREKRSSESAGCGRRRRQTTPRSGKDFYAAKCLRRGDILQYRSYFTNSW